MLFLYNAATHSESRIVLREFGVQLRSFLSHYELPTLSCLASEISLQPHSTVYWLPFAAVMDAVMGQYSRDHYGIH